MYKRQLLSSNADSLAVQSGKKIAETIDSLDEGGRITFEINIPEGREIVINSSGVFVRGRTTFTVFACRNAIASNLTLTHENESISCFMLGGEVYCGGG